MNIQLSGHHVEITDALREAVENKFSKIGSHYPDIDSISAKLTVEPNEQRVEVDTQYFGSTIAIQASVDTKEKDMYAAIAEAAKKFDAALAHKRGVAKPR